MPMKRDRAADSGADSNLPSWPPILAALLGLELLVTKLVWPHGGVQRIGTIVCGVLVLLVAFFAARFPRARFVNVAVGLWLVVASAYALRTSVPRTEYNEIFIGVVLIAISIIPTRPLLPKHRQRHAAA